MNAVRRLAVVGALALALSACSPEVDGITGLTRDSQGRLVGLGQACNGKLLGATLIQDANTPRSQHVGAWGMDAPAKQMAWALQGPSPTPGWSTWQPAPQALVADHAYTLVAWRELNVTNATPLDFTVTDLDALEEGRVLINEPDAAGETHRVAVVSAEEFTRRACEQATRWVSPVPGHRSAISTLSEVGHLFVFDVFRSARAASPL